MSEDRYMLVLADEMLMIKYFKTGDLLWRGLALFNGLLVFKCLKTG